MKPASNKWWTLAQLTAAIAAQGQSAAGASYVLGNSASVIGGRETTPNPSPLTVDSIAANYALGQMSPQLQVAFLAAVGPMAGYYLVH